MNTTELEKHILFALKSKQKKRNNKFVIEETDYKTVINEIIKTLKLKRIIIFRNERKD